MLIKSRKTVYLFLTLIFIFIQALVGYIAVINQNNVLIFIVIYEYIIILNYIWSIFSWYKLRKELISPYILFLTIIYIFTASQSFLWAFNIDINPFYDLRLNFTNYQIIRGLIYTCISLTSFHLGALMLSNLKNKENSLNDIKFDANLASMKAIRRVGWTLFCISIIPLILVLKTQLTTALSVGYSAIYDQEAITGIHGIADDIALYIIPSLICLMIGYSKSGRIKQKLPILFALIYIYIYLLIGLRNKAIVMLVTVICIWHYCVKRIKRRQVFLGAVLGYFLLAFLNIVSRLRSLSGRSFRDYYNLIVESSGISQLVIDTISGMGWSMLPLIKTMEIVPQYYPYRYGTSYLFSITTIIPNIGFWDVHPAMKYSDLSTWLTKTINFPYGTGFSIIAETYINFSWFGPIMMCIIGAILGWYFTRVDKNNWKLNPERLVLMLMIFSMTVMTARNNFLSIIRAIFYYSLPTYLMIYFIKNAIKKKKLK
jgi:oligosaccharide repeat unit polymerase